MGPWLHNKHHSAEMTEIQCSICQQKAEAAAQNTFSNPGSGLKVIIGYFIDKVILLIRFTEKIHCCCFSAPFTVYFKDCIIGWSNELGLEISM